jgi:hypothetical protein
MPDRPPNLTDAPVEPSDPGSIPLATRRVFDKCVKDFKELLRRGTWSNVRRRQSATPTDADVKAAYRAIVEHREADRWARVVGDLAMVLGGVFLPLWTIHWSMSLAGAVLVLIGLFVREFRS